MSLGTNLQQLRKATGLSQEQLAELLDMSRQAVSKWETDQSLPDADKLVQLCRIFQVSADTLLGLENRGNESEVEAQPLAPQNQTGLEACVKGNMQRRCFTLGWVTALVGAVLLIAEYFSLFLIRNAAVRLAVDTGMGYYKEPLKYASVAPMPTIFTLTGILILLGALLSAGSLLYGFLQKKKADTKQ